MSSGRVGRRDLVGALLVAALCIVATVLIRGGFSGGGGQFGAVAVVLTVLASAPIAIHRRAPCAAAILALSAAVLGVALGCTMTGPILVALGLVGFAASQVPERATFALAGFSGAVVAVIALITAADSGTSPLLAVASGLAVGMLPALFGERLYTERMRAQQAREMARRIEELRDHDVQRAVAEERLRIARDVHDLTGHHLSAIALQSSGAGRMTDDPEARAALERIHGLTREALAQTRRALGALRAESDPPALAPPPRLAEVERLLGPLRAAGIDVDLQVDGEVDELAEALELCAYRLIQESLTNVMRHAGAGSVQIVLDYEPAALKISVADDGTVGRSRTARRGSGIEGMRERVALVGGEFAAGPRGGDGWSVTARLPMEARR